MSYFIIMALLTQKINLSPVNHPPPSLFIRSPVTSCPVICKTQGQKSNLVQANILSNLVEVSGKPFRRSAAMEVSMQNAVCLTHLGYNYGSRRRGIGSLMNVAFGKSSYPLDVDDSGCI